MRPCALLEVLAVLTFVGVLAAHFKLVLCLSLLVATSLRVVNFGPLRLALFAGLVKAKKPKHPTLIGKNPFQINVLISLCWHTQCVCVCGGGAGLYRLDWCLKKKTDPLGAKSKMRLKGVLA